MIEEGVDELTLGKVISESLQREGMLDESDEIF